jgi:serine/threonine protein kinase
MACPKEETLVEFAEALLDEAAARAVEEHVDGCSWCRQALAALAKGAPGIAGGSRSPTTPSPGSPPGDDAPAPPLNALAGAALAPGDVVSGRYRVERLLAMGGMGAVHVALHLETEQRVALKILLPSAGASERALEGFRLEARVFSRIPGNHIVRVLDAGLDPDRQLGFIVMELLEGETLAGMVRRQGPIAPATLVPLVLQAASALDAAHTAVDSEGKPAPIVHRDLKPDNIFVVASDGGPSAKVLDFGIAKVISGASDASQEVRGTPQFMAAEQIEGRAAQPETDVAALGLTVFFCLTGRSYWKAASRRDAPMAALIREVMEGTRVPASERARELGASGVELGDAFDTWFARTTAREASGRFRSAGLAATELARVFGIGHASHGPLAPTTRAPKGEVIAVTHAAPKGRTSALPPMSRPSSSRVQRTSLVALAVALATGVLVLVRGGLGRSGAGPGLATSGSGPAVGHSAEAMAAFAEARGELRDGEMDRCVRSLRRAVAADPSLASAQLWLAALVTLRYSLAKDLALARDALEAASLHRDALDPRERVMFDGLQRMLSVEPPDSNALIDALRPAVAKDPRDLVARLLLARALQSGGHFEEATTELRGILAIDPEFATPYGTLASLYDSEFDAEEKRRVLDACLAHVPRAMVCLVNLAWGTGMSCDEIEAHAHRITAVLPSNPSGYSLLAQTLVKENRPEPEVLAVFEQHLARLPEDERRRSEWRVRATAAFEYGHFDEADALAARAIEELPADLAMTPHAYWFRLLAAEEAGDTGRAATTAEAMRSRAGIWIGDWETAKGELLVHALRSGSVDRATFEKERATFRAKIPAVWTVAPAPPEVTAFKRWIDADARTVFTDDDARAADEEFVARGIAFRPRWDEEEVQAAAVFVQAHDFARAREVLAPNLCALHTGRPGFAVRRSLLLGKTLEATGDRSGACAAYGEVLTRWGAAPRSVTADQARSSVKRLGCGH